MKINIEKSELLELLTGCDIDYCQNNQLNKLIIPDSCEYVDCNNNQLKELNIPDVCENVHCYNNQLKELVIPNGCGWVWADMKSVTELNKAYRLNLWI